MGAAGFADDATQWCGKCDGLAVDGCRMAQMVPGTVTNVQAAKGPRGPAVLATVLALVACLLMLGLYWFTTVTMEDADTSEPIGVGAFMMLVAYSAGTIMLIDLAGLALGVLTLVRGDERGWVPVAIAGGLVATVPVSLLVLMTSGPPVGVREALVVAVFYVVPFVLEATVYRKALRLRWGWALVTSLSANIAGLIALVIVGSWPIIGPWLTLPGMMAAELAVLVALNRDYSERRRLLVVGALTNAVTLALGVVGEGAVGFLLT